jgi:outer membrane autotransporter protein
VQTDLPSGATQTISNAGLGETFGAGYDIKLGRNFYITPNADFMVQRINGSSRDLILLTVGATWHSGPSRGTPDSLHLPLSSTKLLRL